MSRRTSILNSLAEEFKKINGESPYKVNIYENAFPKLKFWDEVSDFPCIYMSPGSETREYHPADFSWAFLNISIKVYCKGENSEQELEDLLEDIEKVLDGTKGTIVYGTSPGQETTEVSILSITTDEGLLSPYSVGEINVLIRYHIVK